MIVPKPAHYRLQSLNERIAMLHVITLLTILDGEDALASAMSINGHWQTLAHRIVPALPPQSQTRGTGERLLSSLGAREPSREIAD